MNRVNNTNIYDFFKEYRRKINYKFNNKRKPGMIQKR